MALLSFFAGEGANINNISGSGIGFYGDSGFGYSIPVGSFNGRSFITDSTGTAQGPEVDNNKFAGAGTVIVGQAGSGINLRQLPNYLSTLNIRFTHTSAVQVQNAKLYGYDRSNKTNAPSGVDLYAAQIIHPDLTQVMNGSGSATWVNIKGSGTILALTSGPGVSGLSPNGPGTTAAQHDWYVALSATPTSVGAKEFGSWMELEYL
jgi:hypothetical protein